MSDPPHPPPTPRQALVARAEQVVLVILALVVVAGAVHRAASYWRLGAEPLDAIPAAEATYRVNVNAADWVTLALVPGLGELLARRIVEERERRGGRFETLDDLLAVRGIGPKTLENLRPYLFVGPADARDEPVQMIDAP